MWIEWNMRTDDVMMMWFEFFAHLVMSCLACATCAHVYGTHALNNYGMSKYPSGLACRQTDSNLAKTTTSHFWVLNA